MATMGSCITVMAGVSLSGATSMWSWRIVKKFRRSGGLFFE